MSDQPLDITIDRIEAEASYWRNECDSSDEAQSSYARHELHCKEIDLKAVLERFKAHHPISPGRLKNTEPLGPIKGHRADRNRQVIVNLVFTGLAVAPVAQRKPAMCFRPILVLRREKLYELLVGIDFLSIFRPMIQSTL